MATLWDWRWDLLLDYELASWSVVQWAVEWERQSEKQSELS